MVTTDNDVKVASGYQPYLEEFLLSLNTIYVQSETTVFKYYLPK